jgi:inner membrane protein involved in colicin E2 resistance
MAVQNAALASSRAGFTGTFIPKERNMSDAGHAKDWEHQRDILAIMLAILASHDGIASAKRTALACWEEANSLASTLSESPQLANTRP